MTRTFLAIIALTLFISCQKDDESSLPELDGSEVLQLKTITSRVTAEEIPEIMDYLLTKSD